MVIFTASGENSSSCKISYLSVSKQTVKVQFSLNELVKKIVVLTNRIVDIKLTKFFCYPNKYLVFRTIPFVEPIKEFTIVFFLTGLFVRTKILWGQ